MTGSRCSQAYQRMIDALLGDDPRLRVPVGRTLLGLSIYIACAALMMLNTALEGGDPLAVHWMSAYMLLGPVVCVVLIRSGWSLRQRDFALSVPQSIHAISCAVLAYPLNGPIRGLNLLLVAMLPFFSFLAVRPRQMQWLAALSLAAFGVMMGLLAWLAPTRFDPRIEALHFLVAAVGFPCMALVLGQASSMRAKVKAQRAELQSTFERIELLTTHDDLTGLVNRRHITLRLAEECARASRYGQPLSVALIDIDHFKRINDTLGHAQGDEVLRHFAQVSGKNLPLGVELARWGGEEFLLLFPSAAEEAAMVQVAAMRSRLAQDGRPLASAVTFSAGVASGVGAGAQDLVERADRALHRAKNEGRNRTVCSSALEQP
jgi:diguanylate cyclase (GGDEF)-like protein